MITRIIYNLTQHQTTSIQQSFGVLDVPDQDYIRGLLMFNSLPNTDELSRRANLLANYADYIGAKKVMIGGAPFLMPYLIHELDCRNIESYFAFSKRISQDFSQEDGSVIKNSIFKMEGLIKTSKNS